MTVALEEVVMVDNQMATTYIDRDIIHVMPYGDAGSKKSTLAATFPKPALVLFFDKFAKATPYRRRGKRGPSGIVDGLFTEYVMSTKEPGKAVVKIVHFTDENVKDAGATYAIEHFEAYLPGLYDEVRQGIWATVVLDSLSFLEYASRKCEQYSRNPESKAGHQQDARQWYRDSSEALEEVCFALTSIPSNVVVTAHVRQTHDKQRELMLWSPDAPGKKNRSLPAAFGEVYAMHYDPEEEDVVMQTSKSSDYIACSQINAPNWCAPTYNALWDNWKPVEQD